jgi:hypothetical protein
VERDSDIAKSTVKHPKTGIATPAVTPLPGSWNSSIIPKGSSTRSKAQTEMIRVTAVLILDLVK